MVEPAIFDANWTVENRRNVAKEELVLIKGVITGAAADELSKKYPIPVPDNVQPTSIPESVATGHCYCEQVQLELPLTRQPSISVICHCQDCREWHSVGSIPYMMFPLDHTEDGTPLVPLKAIPPSD